MKILMPLNQKLIDKIQKKTVKYIYKKKIFTQTDITTILVYSTSPIKKIVGEFEVENIVYNTPEYIWKTTQKYSPLTEKQFFKYFKNTHKGYALKIKEFKLYSSPQSLQEYNIKNPPQSFIYIPR